MEGVVVARIIVLFHNFFPFGFENLIKFYTLLFFLFLQLF